MQFDPKIQAFLDFKQAGNLMCESHIGGGGEIMPSLIVSLTSYPLRIPTLHYTLYSLFTQSYKPDKIILWLSLEEFPQGERELPQSVLSFKECGLDIQWCQDNIRSYKKIIPALEQCLDSIIVTADDDIIYPKDWLLRLHNAYVENPKLIHCHRAHRITFDNNGALLPYGKWEFGIQNTQTSPSFLNFSTNGGGVLYPPHSLYKDITKPERFLSLAPLQDDIWCFAMAVLNGTKINVVKDNYTDEVLLGSSVVDTKKTGALWHINSKGENDKALRRVFEAYPALKEKIKFDSSEYWENRYKSFNASNVLNARGRGKSIGASGAGSYNHLAAFKAQILNQFVREEGVQSVLEFGVGDGNQLSLAHYPRYIGLDVSQSALEHTRAKFSTDETKEFYLVDEFLQTHKDFRAQLCLSLDVIYHLIQDEVFEAYMQNLFAHSARFVGIYSSNKDELHATHVKRRRFQSWIEQNAPQWQLYKFVPNAYPFNPKNPDNTSFADFYFYKKVEFAKKSKHI